MTMKMNHPLRVRLCIAALATLVLSGGLAQALGADETAGVTDEPGVLRATLPNGLRVILVRNTLAPVVATSVNYLVGSDEAPAGFPGMAHAQEHMMFRGSPGLTADQLANIGNVMGGNFNANTRESLTQYLYTVPAEDLDVALHIEAVRMQGVLDLQRDWSEERGAIEQEVAQDLSDPGYVLYERLRSIAFAGTPYEHDALGTRPSFDKTSARMLKVFMTSGMPRTMRFWSSSAILSRRRRSQRSRTSLATSNARLCRPLPKSCCNHSRRPRSRCPLIGRTGR